MKRKSILALVLILIITLSACTASGNAEAPSPTPSQSASLSPTPSQPVTYTVKTDYSGLTPYKPMEEVYTRLTEDYMPELIPSDDYGPLLPYVGEVLYGYHDTFDGLVLIGDDKGFITLKGKMVTDAVYSDIYHPYHYDSEAKSYIAESLYIIKKIFINDTGDDGFMKYAVCAEDGSWITPFDYEDILECDKVMLLFRDRRTNDVDVMDYTGRILYNTKTLDSFALLCDDFFTSYDTDYPSVYHESGEGFVAVTKNEKGYFLDELDGNLIQTEFSDVGAFSDGVTSAEKDGLCGYVDSNLNFVIAPTFARADTFKNGTALVEFTYGGYAMIDRTGKIVARSPDFIYDNGCYFETGNYSETSIYKRNGKNILHSSTVDAWDTFGDGLYYVKNNTTYIYCGDRMMTLPGVYEVYSICDGYFSCRNDQNKEFKIITLEGKVIAELDKPFYISSILNTPNGVYLLLNDYDNNAFAVIDNKGRSLTSGHGRVYANKGTGLFYISDDRFFAYMDTSGKYIFKISLQDNIPD